MIAIRFSTTDFWNWLGYWNTGEWTVAAICVGLLVAVAVSNYRASCDDAAVRIQFRWVLLAMLLSSGSIFGSA